MYRDEETIRARLMTRFEDDPHHAEKFNIFRSFIEQNVTSKRLINVYNARRAAFTLHLIISSGYSRKIPSAKTTKQRLFLSSLFTSLFRSFIRLLLL